MPSREDIVQEAREWVGTPWRHQGRLKGVSSDCAGLVMGVGIKLGLIVIAKNDPMYRHFDGYGHQPRPELMVQALMHWLIKLEHPSRALMGDVIYRRYNDANPQHLAILTGPLLEPMSGVIHAIAMPSKGRRRGAVVEQRTDNTWTGAAVHSAWRYHGVTHQ